MIKMAPGRVDSNKKRAKSSISQVEEELFYIDTMSRTVSGPNQATVHLARKQLKNYIMNVLMREKHGNFQFQSCYVVDYPCCFAPLPPSPPIPPGPTTTTTTIPITTTTTIIPITTTTTNIYR